MLGDLRGPVPLSVESIGPLNRLFSDAFTDRYRRDGLAGVRVPPLNPEIWRYAIVDAGAGAMAWQDLAGQLVAFNVAHASGREGWMGPLAVHEAHQGRGVGAQIVRAGIEALRQAGCTTIGLETMPRTMDNIGFYAQLGFIPAGMTITLTLEAARAPRPTLLSALGVGEREVAVARCAQLTDALSAGVDFTREIALTMRLGIGDLILLGPSDAPTGFALYHSAPLVEGRARDELRVLKCALRDAAALDALVQALAAAAQHEHCQRAAVRVQEHFGWAFQALVARGARVRWTDLRMTLADAPERHPTAGLLLSNWEI
ncbi:MAG: GNAT family N-acetyltransferase [Gemmatimonadaceae bacterium]|nr:GNAT family N-acetyltransferase [Gemmatimonadaceae bacterium]